MNRNKCPCHLAALGLAVVFLLGNANKSCADILATVNAPFSNPPFGVTGGYSVSYTPSSGIDLTNPSGFPQPNTDLESDNKFGVSLNYGGTGYTVLTSRHVFENSPEIALTVGLLNANKPYEVHVQTFVNTGSDFYGGRYGFASGQLTSYFYSSGGDLLATGTNGPSGQGQFQIREFNLGVHVAQGNQLTLYLDDFDATSRVGNFAAMRLTPVPEPTTGLLLLFGILGFVAMRLRRRDDPLGHEFTDNQGALAGDHG